MKITVKSLANIKNAKDVEIKKFNVFIGKNGTGKTYFAKLIYFILSTKYKTYIFQKIFLDKLKIFFDDMVSKNLNEFSIIFNSSELDRFKKELEIHIKKNFPRYIGSDNSLFKNFTFSIDNIFESKTGFFIKVESLTETHDNFDVFLHHLEDNFYKTLFGVTAAHYLPAARANYMVTYKYLFESLYNNVRNILLNKNLSSNFDILPEIENNFLTDIYKVNTKNHSAYSSLGKKIETQIFRNGKLSIRNPKSQDLPTYEYKLNNINESLQLVSTSSSITELSPLVMYFRHKISSLDSDILIFDEPELSLHPDAQAILVEILVEAYQKGLKIILVTHSPYIIEAINNHLMRSKIDDKTIKDLKIKNMEKLSSDDLGAYLFEDDTIKNILDNDIKLIDDKLLDSFNNINSFYEKMRDIEFHD
ncbi:ATP-binding protein (AAA domain) [Aliarcobacter cibarius]|uniref:AAA family ATPase n=1 Tax=Aliarcobacter cibarius TaxID=255507 RepID=UPI001245BCC9|nr:AAA family ATPase [Aliarcobacter cibarius]QEZ89058.1 ATP-binding protein (AAA domain) [Aliarcobacter cibarius]